MNRQRAKQFVFIVVVLCYGAQTLAMIATVQLASAFSHQIGMPTEQSPTALVSGAVQSS
jgi:hypothetical protein